MQHGAAQYFTTMDSNSADAKPPESRASQRFAAGRPRLGVQNPARSWRPQRTIRYRQIELIAARSAVRVSSELFNAGGAGKIPFPVVGATVTRVSIGTTVGRRRGSLLLARPAAGSV